jgi:hypothetical protein
MLASDASLPEALLPYLSASGITDVGVLTEMVRQWQQAILQQMQLEQELARKKQRPVWRCRVCGLYNCSFAPYIERYEDVPE